MKFEKLDLATPHMDGWWILDEASGIRGMVTVETIGGRVCRVHASMASRMAGPPMADVLSEFTIQVLKPKYPR